MNVDTWSKKLQVLHKGAPPAGHQGRRQDLKYDKASQALRMGQQNVPDQLQVTHRARQKTTQAVKSHYHIYYN